MERFQPNTKFYKQNFESFSSKDEFDAKKRVQMTNEVPPMDMFDIAHSMIKNDLWKWFMGYSLVMNGLTYNEDTDGVETIDNEGTITNLTVAKYVNGVRAKDYGPIPEKKWNPNYKKDYKEYLDFIADDPTVEDNLTEDDFKYTVDYSKSEGRRIEINGALLPEFDLLLHEAYRYLSVLYPDHPDFMTLLTMNEFEDDISQAATLIDYSPDHVFFNWLVNRLDYSDVDKDFIEDAKIEEAAKLKIRNLLNHSLRRKFFGSKTGYKMFGSDIFQHVSVFPAAQVIPYKYYNDDRTEYEEEHPRSVDFKWLRSFEEKPESFTARKINKSHALYKKCVRLFDWTNESYKFPDRYVEPAKFYGTAWPTPYSQFILYEYPLQRVLDETDVEAGFDVSSLSRTFKTKFKVGQKINIGGQDNNWADYQTGHIASIREEHTYKVELDLNDDGTGKFTVHSNPNTLTSVDIDVPVKPFYTELTIWPSNKEIVSKIAEYEDLIYHCQKDGLIDDIETRKKKSIFNDTNKDIWARYNSSKSLKDSTELLHEAFYTVDIDKKFENEGIKCRKPTIGKFTPDPHQNGCLYMAPEQYMTIFEDNLNILLDTTPWDNYTEKTFYDEKTKKPTDWPKSEVIYGVTNMSDDGLVKKGDIITYDGEEKKFSSQVLGLSNAYVQFKISEGKASYEDLKAEIAKAENAETSRHGIVVKLSENNENSRGKKVVFYGNPEFGLPVEIDRYRHFVANNVYFNIKAIPRVKSHMAMRAIYGKDFTDACKEKYEALETLLGVGDGKSKYSKIKKDIDTFVSSYDDLQNAFEGIRSALAAGKLLYNDSNWKKLKKASSAYISLFEDNRPVLYKQVLFIFTDWIGKYNVSVESLVTVEELDNAIKQLRAVFEEYYYEYYLWQIEEAAIDASRDHYIDFFTKDFGNNIAQKNAMLKLKAADEALYENMMPNRAFLLDPLPEDLLMQSMENMEESSYSLLTGQDEFIAILEFEKNKYDDMIAQKRNDTFGTAGLLQNCMEYSCDAWNFGSLNTATVIETHWDAETDLYETEDVTDNVGKVDFIDDYFNSSQKWIKEYSVMVYDNTKQTFVEEEDRITQEEYEALDSHTQKHYYRLDDGNYRLEHESQWALNYKSLNEDTQKLFDKDDSQHKFAYGDPNMMEMFLEDD